MTNDENRRPRAVVILVSSFMAQMLTFLTFVPAKTVLAVAPLTSVRAWIGGLPFLSSSLM